MYHKGAIESSSQVSNLLPERPCTTHNGSGGLEIETNSLNGTYKRGDLGYSPRSGPAQLDLPRAILARLLSIRSVHGDFASYHLQFHHDDANFTCSCGLDKTPEHLVLCRKTLETYSRWPLKPYTPPSSRDEGLAYTAILIEDLEAFEAFFQITKFYTEVCPR